MYLKSRLGCISNKPAIQVANSSEQNGWCLPAGFFQREAVV